MHVMTQAPSDHPTNPRAHLASLYTRVFALVVAALVGYAVFQILSPFASALTWAILLAFILHPINLRLRRKMRGRKGVPAGILTTLTPIVILLPLSAVSVQFVLQVSSLLQRVQDAARRFDVHGFQDLGQFPWVMHATRWLQEQFSVSAQQLQSWAVSGTQELLQRAAGVGSFVFLGTLSTVTGFFLMIVLLFFFLRDGDVMFARTKDLIPFDDRRKNSLITHIRDLTRAIVFGTAVTAAAQGAMVAIGFAICGLPSPLVFGVLAALLSMLPVGGAAIIWVPGAIALFMQGRWGYGTFLLVWGTVLSSFDNLLRPLLISGRAQISTLAVFIGVLGGISAFGAVGIIAGPIILSAALVLLQYAAE